MVFSPEKGLVARANETHETERMLFESVLPHVQRILVENQIKMSDFEGLYAADRIARNTAHIEWKKKEADVRLAPDRKESKKPALVFEGIFHKGVNKHGWLGEGARVIKTSEYDDWENGVDGIIEFQDPQKIAEHLAVGVDVTFSGQLTDKFRRIQEDLQKGKLSMIDYFRSGNYRGELSNVPRVIVGVDFRHLMDLCRDVFLKPDDKRLLKHPVQVLQLKEMVLELEAFAGYASRMGHASIATTLSRDALIVRKILQKKSAGEGIRMGEWEHDKVFQAIQKELEAFK